MNPLDPTSMMMDPTGNPVLYMGELNFNLCLNGYQDIALGTIANPLNPLNPAPAPVGLMLQCKGPEENHTMIVKRFTGNCYGISASAPINTFKIPLKDQDAFLRGECLSMGDSGFIRFTGLNALNSAQMGFPAQVPVPYGNTTIMIPFPVFPMLGNKLTNCSQFYDSGAAADPNGPTAAPTFKLWDWAMVKKQYTDVNGVDFDMRLPTWKSWYVPKASDPKPVSNSG